MKITSGRQLAARTAGSVLIDLANSLIVPQQKGQNVNELPTRPRMAYVAMLWSAGRKENKPGKRKKEKEKKEEEKKKKGGGGGGRERRKKGGIKEGAWGGGGEVETREEERNDNMFW